MDVDRIFRTMNECQVAYMLIGGMNFLLRHEPVLTFDVDLWIEDGAANRRACERALGALDAEWGRSDDDWGPVVQRPPGWLDAQPVYCLSCRAGAVDIFRSVLGLDNWAICQARALSETTASGIGYRGLSDADMLQCQMALDEPFRRTQRVMSLERILTQRDDPSGTE